NDRPDAQVEKQPYLALVESDGGRVGVSRARYDADAGTLHIGLRQVGDPDILRHEKPVLARLVLGNVAGEVCVEGVEEEDVKVERLPNGDFSLGVNVAPESETVLLLRCS
ncbi:MAG: hypothetical protein ABIQ44_12425, partial [Chloroflexia bacterium]